MPQLGLRDVRGFGDSAPGDARTTQDVLDLELGPDMQRRVLDFPLAPPGLYSRLDLRLDTYTVRGVVSAGGQPERSFEVIDADPSRSASPSIIFT